MSHASLPYVSFAKSAVLQHPRTRVNVVLRDLVNPADLSEPTSYVEVFPLGSLKPGICFTGYPDGSVRGSTDPDRHKDEKALLDELGIVYAVLHAERTPEPTAPTPSSSVVPSAQYLESMKYRDTRLFVVDLTDLLYHPDAKVHIIQHDPHPTEGVQVSAVVVARAKPHIQHLFRLRSRSTGEGSWSSFLELPIPDTTDSTEGEPVHPDPTPAFMDLVRTLDIPFSYERARR